MFASIGLLSILCLWIVSWQKVDYSKPRTYYRKQVFFFAYIRLCLSNISWDSWKIGTRQVKKSVDLSQISQDTGKGSKRYVTDAGFISGHHKYIYYSKLFSLVVFTDALGCLKPFRYPLAPHWHPADFPPTLHFHKIWAHLSRNGLICDWGIREVSVSLL